MHNCQIQGKGAYMYSTKFSNEKSEGQIQVYANSIRNVWVPGTDFTGTEGAISWSRNGRVQKRLSPTLVNPNRTMTGAKL